MIDLIVHSNHVKVTYIYNTIMLPFYVYMLPISLLSGEYSIKYATSYPTNVMLQTMNQSLSPSFIVYRPCAQVEAVKVNNYPCILQKLVRCYLIHYNKLFCFLIVI